MTPISRNSAPHYAWGEGCDGWHLVKSDRLSVIQEEVPSGRGEHAHTHRQAEQFFYVLFGIATIVSNGHTYILKAEDGLHVPAGTLHELRNDHDKSLRFLVISTPPSHGDRIDIG